MRDDDDASWGNRYGKENMNQNFSEEKVGSSDINGGDKHESRMITLAGEKSTKNLNYMRGNPRIKIIESKFVSLNGPTEDEMNGLDLEERKRKRIGPVGVEAMQTDGEETTFTESVLSRIDCAESITKTMATLAKQDSRTL